MKKGIAVELDWLNARSIDVAPTVIGLTHWQTIVDLL